MLRSISRAAAALLLFAAIASAQFFGGGGGAKISTVSWGLCVGSNCTTATTITVPWIAPAKAQFEKCFIAAGTGPVGAALIVDIHKAGTSIFSAGRLQIADGSTAGNTAAFASTALKTLAEGDLLTIDIDQTGTTTPGKNVFVTCRLALK